MKQITHLFIAMCMAMLGSIPSAAFDQIYICGEINDQGWDISPKQVITLSDPENGWFRLDVASPGEFKVSSTLGYDWTDFNVGCMKFELADKSLNNIYTGTKISSGNSSLPSGVRIVYFSYDLERCAISDGTWTPAGYHGVEPVSYQVWLHSKWPAAYAKVWDAANNDTSYTGSGKNGYIAYSTPIGLSDITVDIYSPAGSKASSYTGLIADGCIHQIPTRIMPGIYIIYLSATNSDGSTVTKRAKYIL